MNAISDRSKILLTSTVIMMATILVVDNIMAQNVWNGSVSGDWGNAANWDVSSSFGAGKQIIFHAPGAANLETYLGAFPRTIGGLIFTADVDSDVSVITATSAASDGNNKILIFDNGANPVYITVEEGAEGNIAVAPRQSANHHQE